MATAVGFPVSDLKEEESTADWMPLATMTRCLRCSGLLVVEQGIEFPVWRCVQCGEMIDPVIFRNRVHNNNSPT
jgi:hypothetical protein